VRRHFANNEEGAQMKKTNKKIIVKGDRKREPLMLPCRPLYS